MGMLEGKVALITGAGNSNCAALSYANARSSKFEVTVTVSYSGITVQLQ